MQGMATVSLLAAQVSLGDKLRHLPFQSIVNLGLCVLAVLIIVRVWKVLRQVNEFMPWLAVAIACIMILSYWTYNRTEPRFLSPLVDKLTLILPTKAKHAEDLERWRRSRN